MRGRFVSNGRILRGAGSIRPISIVTVTRRRRGRNGAARLLLRPASVIRYVHVQRGDLLIGSLATTSAGTVGAMWVAGPSVPVSVALLLQLAVTLAFCSSVIEITNSHIRVSYGAGWIKRGIRLGDIVSVSIVTSVLAYGWGVRRAARGYTYRPSHSLAVELHLKNGRSTRVGTDRPLELVNAILQAAHDEAAASGVRSLEPGRTVAK